MTSRHLTIFQKLALSYLFVGGFTMLCISLLFYNTLQSAIIERTLAQLASINQLKKVYVEEHLEKGNIDDLNHILLVRTGMGETGESYLVDGLNKLRSYSRFFPDKEPQTITAQTEGVIKARQNGYFTGKILDYRGEYVYSVGRKLNLVNKQDWVLMTEIDEAEALKPVYEGLKTMMLIIILSTGFLWIFTFFLANRISNPIVKLKNVILGLAQGRVPRQIPMPENNVELSEMTLALQKLCDALRTHATFAHNIGKGNFDVDFQPLSNDDIHGWALLEMRNQLVRLREQEKNMQRQRTIALFEGQESERKRIAKELHDGVGQMLTAIRFRIELLQGDEQIKKDTKSIIDETITEIRRISNNLMPSVLLDFGLESALGKLCHSTAQVSGIHFDYTYSQPEDLHDDDYDIDICLYRVAQEAINNIVKHAQATQVTLKVSKFTHSASLEICDNGKGFDRTLNKQATPYSGNGLQNMEERVKLLNGSIKIESEVGKGTCVRVKL